MPQDDADEQRLTADVIELARQYGRYGYRKIHGLVQQAGWEDQPVGSGADLARELKVPKKQPKRADCGSMTGHVPGCAPGGRVMSGAGDFVEDITHNGGKYRM